jgi:23S rRNA (adenine2030-N6)-methyltransferase
MNYRHAYHAGNFADVMKHATLTLILNYMKQKEKPFFVLDTHAGTGMTDLTGEEAQKTGEWKDGIGRLLTDENPHELIKPYLESLATFGCQGTDPKQYPGSPMIAYQLARAQDRLSFCELHPADAASLKELFHNVKRAKVHQLDGYTALKSMLPPPERRGIILIDPPFEARTEYVRILQEITHALERFAGGTYMVWYPIKDPSIPGAFLDHLERHGPPKTLRAELHVVGDKDPTRMTGSGLVIINPPWKLDEELQDLFSWLAQILSRGQGAHARVDWLKK